jgi:hypothetical protein
VWRLDEIHTSPSWGGRRARRAGWGAAIDVHLGVSLALRPCRVRAQRDGTREHHGKDKRTEHDALTDFAA